MDDPKKFLLPSPNFDKTLKAMPVMKPHFLTPSGMTLHSREQPPPMYGKRGATYPSRYLQGYLKTTPTVGEEEHIERQLCEACDMELHTVDDLRRHCAQHEPCPVDGCKYRGHPTVMDKHVTTFHFSGLFQKFKTLSTPEEIAAWREERRRKYPTVENVIMRQRAQEQRQKRGERLEANKSRFGKREDRKRAKNTKSFDHSEQINTQECQKEMQMQSNNKQNSNGMGRDNKRRRRSKLKRTQYPKQNASPVVPEKTKTNEPVCVEEDAEGSCCGIKMFCGTGRLKEYRHMKAKVCEENNALTSLLGMYGTDDEDEDDDDDNKVENLTAEPKKLHVGNMFHLEINDDTVSGVNQQRIMSIDDTPDLKDVHKETEESKEETSATPNSTSLNESTLTNLNDHSNVVAAVDNSTNVDSDDEAPDEVPIERTTNLPSPAAVQTEQINPEAASSLPPEQQLEKIKKIEMRKSGLRYQKTRLRKQNTMLRKLLEPDIRHERNVLLQCVRFVCENKFFGVGQNSNSNNLSK